MSEPRPSGWGRRLSKAALLCLAFVAAWWTLAYFGLRSMLFPRGYASAPHQMPAGARRIWIESPEGKVEAWFLPGGGASAERPAPAVLYAHANVEILGDDPSILQGYRDLGVSVLACEYRGYGRSAGSPSEAAIVEDFVKFYDRLAELPEVDRTRIVFHGRSVGGGVVCALSERRKPAAMILQSTFRSVRAMALRWGLPGFLVRDSFDSEAALRRFDGPVLFFHGTEDRVVPFSQGLALSAATKQAKFVQYECGHNDLPPDSAAYWLEIAVFLAGL